MCNVAFRYTLFRFFKRYCSLCTGNFVVVSSAAAPAGLKPRRKVGPPEESTNFHRDGKKSKSQSVDEH
jgi:hypothetical protein